MPVIQNVSVPAGDDIEITFDLDDNTVIDLDQAVIRWNVYETVYGIPVEDTDPVISKSTESGGGIDIPGSPADIFNVTLLGADTKGMLHNYYHEAFVEDVNGQRSTITVGVFTVSPTKIASAL